MSLFFKGFDSFNQFLTRRALKWFLGFAITNVTAGDICAPVVLHTMGKHAPNV